MTEAEEEQEKLRVDSEAREIIHDVNSLKNKDELQKTRWVWEFLQNAKDTDEGLGVDIIFQLDEDRITISHNGAPFETKHLIALLYKKSTKSLGGDDGTTGKYGTGFVTTHILNKKVQIVGIHKDKNSLTKRKFQLEIDRSSVSLEETKALIEMKNSIKITFDKINSLASMPSEVINTYEHSFIYSLSDASKHYAERGLDELEKNVIFTLLINKGDGVRKKIKSITISRNGNSKKYEIEPNKSKILGLNYLNSGDNSGLLYIEKDKITFGIPVEETNEGYALKSLENKAVLFKEFPLIGTEYFNLPVFIQHNDFRPTEPRDGIVTKRDDEDVAEFTTDSNRNCLLDFKNEYILFLEMIISAKVRNLHFLALSGLPTESKQYTGKEWYISNIQQPLREFLKGQELVSTVSSDLIKIEDAKFPSLNIADENSFYKVVAGLLPEKVPVDSSISFWEELINQEIENWPENISISLEQLLSKLPEVIDTNKIISYDSLNVVYQYLSAINSTLGESFPIYLNEKNELKVRDEVKIYPKIDNEIKFVSKKLGRDLDLEFLNTKLGNDVPGIAHFDLDDFYKKLNNEVISPLQPENATEEQVLAILHINTLFKTDKAFKRENWLRIIRELMPKKFGEKKLVSIDYDNYHLTAELWTAKYICWLIQKENNINHFAKKYFEENIDSTYDWLNRFLTYLNDSRDDIKGFLTRYNVVPTQENGVFKSDSENLFKEDNPAYFDEELKTIVKEKCGFNSKEHLIKNQITVNGFRSTTVDILTRHIDKLFEDEKITSKIGVGKELNSVFNIVNSWFDKNSNSASYLKTFASKRNLLYVISLGDGFSRHIKALTDAGKSIEDIAELAEINLTAEEMKQLDKVASELGTSELLKKAEEMILLRNQRIKWKQIGTSAEIAFKAVFEGLEMDIELSNPDVGKDFELILKSKNYSIEIKNVIEGKEIVRMSILQGRTAVKEKENYALCVMTRPNDDIEINPEYFIKHASFVTNIGVQIGDKIKKWDEGLINLAQNEDIKVNLDSKTETVYINRSIWKKGISFGEFIKIIETLFANEAN